jgi:hypothetical protein
MTTPRHTPQQWRELVARLTAVRDNPAESSERRARAEDILASIRRNPDAQVALRPAPAPRPTPRLSDLSWAEMDY